MLKKPFLKGRTLRKKVNTLRQRNCHLKKVVSEQRKMILEGKKAMEKLLKEYQEETKYTKTMKDGTRRVEERRKCAEQENIKKTYSENEETYQKIKEHGKWLQSYEQELLEDFSFYMHERDQLVIERDDLLIERDNAMSDRKILLWERDHLRDRCKHIEFEKRQAQNTCSKLKEERNHLRNQLKLHEEKRTDAKNRKETQSVGTQTKEEETLISKTNRKFNLKENRIEHAVDERQEFARIKDENQTLKAKNEALVQQIEEKSSRLQRYLVGVWDLRQFVGINLDKRRPKIRSAGPELFKELVGKIADATTKLKTAAEQTQNEINNLRNENKELKTKLQKICKTY